MKLIVPTFILVFIFSCKNWNFGPNKTNIEPEKAPINVVQVDSIKLPFISPGSGTISYGKEVILSSTQADVVFDYSLDEGKTWLIGSKKQIFSKTALLYRARKGSKVSNSLRANFVVKFNRVLILGNSMLFHGESKALNWPYNWGMAASKPENDFLHLVSAHLKELNKDVVIKSVNIADFEKDYRNYDLKKLQEYDDFNADLVIIRLGDNAESYTNDFGEYYRKVVEKVTKAEPYPRLICTSNFWKKENVMFQIEDGLRPPVKAIYINITSMIKDPSNMALGLFSDKSVSEHPSDKGMKAIADSLISKINL